MKRTLAVVIVALMLMVLPWQTTSPVQTHAEIPTAPQMVSAVKLSQPEVADGGTYAVLNVPEPPNDATQEVGPALPLPSTGWTDEASLAVREGPVIYIDCPYTLEYQEPNSNEWQEAYYIEPEFEVLPENVLWVIDPSLNYRFSADFGGRLQNLHPASLPEGVGYAFDVIYTGVLPEGSLGTLQAEWQETINGVNVVYRSVLKFVADDGVDMRCSPNFEMTAEGVFRMEFHPSGQDAPLSQDDLAQADSMYRFYTLDASFGLAVPVHTWLDPTVETVYTADLGHYLYPYGVPRSLQWYFDQFPMDTTTEAVG